MEFKAILQPYIIYNPSKVTFSAQVSRNLRGLSSICEECSLSSWQSGRNVEEEHSFSITGPEMSAGKKKSLTAAEWFVLSFNYVIITLN